ncbi:hypothetical protein HWV62_29084 [Athelia sp. TMB]|nr:hypothetical protein HWV62_28986 [Athelia sp. TMB]KAF7982355.1 hypothetical protein HWV62_29084 [Athelia sp. TMB]
MSFSVDDLVSSLSGSHIGQEAMDLATLQSQLAQTLFAQQIQIQPSRRASGEMQPCNTPTTRSRSSTLSFGQIGDTRRSHRSITTPQRSRTNSISENGTWGDMDETDEDEAMVEDLVTPSSPVPVPSYLQQVDPRAPVYGESPSASMFTSTDPFYMAQLQALQNPQPANSVFAQAGRPAQHSPFLQHVYGQAMNC